MFAHFQKMLLQVFPRGEEGVAASAFRQKLIFDCWPRLVVLSSKSQSFLFDTFDRKQRLLVTGVWRGLLVAGVWRVEWDHLGVSKVVKLQFVSVHAIAKFEIGTKVHGHKAVEPAHEGISKVVMERDLAALLTTPRSIQPVFFGSKFDTKLYRCIDQGSDGRDKASLTLYSSIDDTRFFRRLCFVRARSCA